MKNEKPTKQEKQHKRKKKRQTNVIEKKRYELITTSFADNCEIRLKLFDKTFSYTHFLYKLRN